MKRAFLLLLCLLLLSGCGSSQEPVPPSSEPSSTEVSDPPATPDPPQEPTNAERASTLIATLTLEEKAGQLFFARCPASGGAEDAAAWHLGGYILFARDFKNKTANEIIQTIQSYQDAAEIPLLVGVDEEGGTVVRVSSNPHLRSRKFQSPQKISANGGLESITADTHEKDMLLRALGINVNLAPVADVSTNPKDFIYPRSFGQDASSTAEYVAAVTTTMHADGMGAVLKHFPGYGNNADTHTGSAVDDRPLETFTTSDFLPFRAGVTSGPGTTAVLVSHNIMTCVDERTPSSLSPYVISLLRSELDFDGVVMTDDLAMDAVQDYGSAAVLAVLAGNDLLISSDYTHQIPQVIDAVMDGTIPESRLDESVQRILLWKMELGLL